MTSRGTLTFGLMLLLAGCAGQSPAPPPVRGASSVEAGEAVWHLRAGLNVAALTCKGRGRTPVAGHYARILTRHKGLLANAYANEQRRLGKGFDRQQTRLYNRFSNQKDPAKFCGRAASVARQAAAMDSPTLAVNARRLLADLD
ncbi:MAG: hypothetical protein GXC70_07610 [Sphingomonadaceae bacterium]|nr:hypothetical protein [Sphingomonadaceae bacterium]